MSKNSLPKQTRLLTVNEFAFVFQQPTRIKKTGIILFSRINTLTYPRLGLAIAKKYIKYAHERNRIKRHMRETFRINQHNLSSSDFIFTLYSKKILNLKNYLLIKELQKLWRHHFLL